MMEGLPSLTTFVNIIRSWACAFLIHVNSALRRALRWVVTTHISFPVRKCLSTKAMATYEITHGIMWSFRRKCFKILFLPDCFWRSKLSKCVSGLICIRIHSYYKISRIHLDHCCLPYISKASQVSDKIPHYNFECREPFSKI